MNYILYRILFGGSKHLASLEHEIFEAFVHSLSVGDGQIAHEQLAAVQLVHRNTRGKLLLLKYFDKEPNVARFANRCMELCVCTMDLATPTETVRVDVIAEDGLLMGLKYSQSPHAISRQGCSITNVKIVNDISHQDQLLAEHSGPLLSELERVVPISSIIAPAREDVLVAFLGRCGDIWPTDFVELLRECNGFGYPQGTFEGTKSREIIQEDLNLQVLAENADSDCCLALLIDGKKSETVPIWWVDEESGERLAVGSAFMPAFKEFVIDFRLSKWRSMGYR